MSMMDNFFDKYSPPGYTDTYRKLPRIVGLMCLLATAYSLQFWNSYHTAIEETKYWSGAYRIIPSFTYLLSENECMIIFVITLCAILTFAVAIRISMQREGSYIIWKRVADPFELEKRIFTLPLICIIGTAVWGWMITLLYYKLYLHRTPDNMLPQVTWEACSEDELFERLILLAIGIIVWLIVCICGMIKEGKHLWDIK